MKPPIRRTMMSLDNHSADKGVTRRRRAAISGLTAMCFCLLLLAGCGGKADKQTTGVGDEFASKALAVCEAALKDKHDWQPFPVSGFDPSDPDASKFPEVSTWLAKQVAPTFHMWVNGMQALGTPPTAKEEWNAVLAAVKKIDQLNSDQIAAANKRDAAAFAAATSALDSIQDELVAASKRAGVGDCADVHAA
jgi:hypothetical protein